MCLYRWPVLVHILCQLLDMHAGLISCPIRHALIFGWCFFSALYNPMATPASCSFTMVMTACIPLSSAVNRSFITSLGAVYCVASDTRGLSIVYEKVSSSSSADYMCSMNTSNPRSCIASFFTLSSWRLLRDGRLSEGQKTVWSWSSSRLKTNLVSCKMRNDSDHVTQNLSLAWPFIVISMMPLYILHVLLIHSVAWSAWTWLNCLWSSSLQRFHKKTGNGSLVQSSRWVSCLQGKVAFAMHSLCGHILWVIYCEPCIAVNASRCGIQLPSFSVLMKSNNISTMLI